MICPHGTAPDMKCPECEAARRTNHIHAALARDIEAELQREMGRRYNIDWAKLDAGELREMHRLLRDMQYEKQLAKRRAITQPWRR